MTTGVLDRAQVERITEQARQAHPGTVILGVLAWLLVNAAFAVARLCSVAWLSVAWAGVALHQGWVEGRSREWQAAVNERKARRQARASHLGPR